MSLVFLTVLLVLYFCLIFYLRSGLRSAKATKINRSLPKVSVIVAARNEQKNIAACISALSQLAYRNDLLEIIIVDDQSSDATARIIEEGIKGKKFIRSISSELADSQLRGKVRALVAGIKHSSGEIIMVTDADCTVPPQWVNTTVEAFHDHIVAVCGFTTVRSSSLLTEILKIDLLFLLSIAAGLMNKGRPVSCIGNNMAFRRSAYEACGGYEHIAFSVTEDYALLQAFTHLYGASSVYVLNGGNKVVTEPPQNFNEVLRQKKRWAVGSLNATVSNALIIISFITAALLPICFLFIYGFWYFLISFAAKTSIDIVLLSPALSTLGEWKSVKVILLFEFYLMMYLFVLPLILAVNKRVIWKEREYL